MFEKTHKARVFFQFDMGFTHGMPTLYCTVNNVSNESSKRNVIYRNFRINVIVWIFPWRCEKITKDCSCETVYGPWISVYREE